jgi:hypothetical protein
MRIHRDWGEAQGNYDEFRFFTGLRPSEQIALVVTDFDPVQGVLSVTKARVHGIDKDVTKTAEDRRVVLCPRALAVLGRQLQLRARLVQEGAIDHAQLFFTAEGGPIRELAYPYARWQRTLRSLAIRYRKPYAARHSSVSWDLMIGRNPLFVAKQHGHSLTTMLSIYAAWVEGAQEVDVVAIRAAINVGGATVALTVGTEPRSESSPAVLPAASARRMAVRPVTLEYGTAARRGTSRVTTVSQGTAAPKGLCQIQARGREPTEPQKGFGSEFGSETGRAAFNYLKSKKKVWRRGWDSNPRAGITRPSDFESAPL